MAFTQKKLGYTVYKARVGELSDQADGTIAGNRLVEIDASADLVEGSVNSLTVIGVNLGDTQKLDGETIDIGVGFQTVVAATPVSGGRRLKCADNGRVCHLVDADVAGDSIISGAQGAAFTNQPANDSVTVVSDSAADTTQTVTIIGTTNGGVVVVVEEIALNGTTPVVSTKVDWGLILAVKTDACAGTLTVKESSGGLTITTRSAGQTSVGVNVVSAANLGAHNVIPVIVGSGATTKVVGYKYQSTADATAYEAKALNGATDVTMVNAALLVTEVYTGDVESSRTVAVKVGAEEDENRCIGRAYDAAAAEGDRFLAYITP